MEGGGGGRGCDSREGREGPGREGGRGGREGGAIDLLGIARGEAYCCNGRGLLEDSSGDEFSKVQDCSHGDAEDAEGKDGCHRPAMQGCLIICAPSLAAESIQCAADTQQKVEQKVEHLRSKNPRSVHNRFQIHAFQYRCIGQKDIVEGR